MSSVNYCSKNNYLINISDIVAIYKENESINEMRINKQKQSLN